MEGLYLFFENSLLKGFDSETGSRKRGSREERPPTYANSIEDMEETKCGNPLNWPESLQRKFYGSNRKKFIRALSDESSPKCRLSVQTIRDHFQKENQPDGREALDWTGKLRFEENDEEILLSPITPKEVQTRLSKTNCDSTPGPSGVTFGDLKDELLLLPLASLFLQF